MEKYFVCLLDSHLYKRGDIVTRRPGVGPPDKGWAGFEPPEGLCGMPVLSHVEDNGTGSLILHYSVESGLTFKVEARIGLPQAYAVIEQPNSPRDNPAPVPKSRKPVLKFGAGLVATAGRGFCGFVSKSGLQAPSAPKEEKDILRDFSGPDILRK